MLTFCGAALDPQYPVYQLLSSTKYNTRVKALVADPLVHTDSEWSPAATLTTLTVLSQLPPLVVESTTAETITVRVYARRLLSRDLATCR